MFVEGLALLLSLDLALLLGCVFDVVCCGGSVGGDDGCGVALLAIELRDSAIERYVPMNVPVEATRKARKGTVSARKEWYLLLAAMTPAAPIAVPMAPPIEPPLIVALEAISTKFPSPLECNTHL